MKQVVLITGATGAIGSATARALARKGCQLVLLGRSPEKLAALQKLILQENSGAQLDLYTADFEDLGAVQKVGQEIQIQHPKIHALIHNAAVFRQAYTVTRDGLETMFTVNHLAPFVLTRVLFENIQNTPESRILTVTAPSTTQLNFQDLMGSQKFSALTQFGATKMANLLFAFRLARAGVISHALHPGLVKSDLLQEANPLLRWASGLVSGTPEKTAQAFSEVATDHRYVLNSGQFYQLNRPIQAAAYARDPQNQDQLWDASLKHLNGLEAAVRG